MASLDPGQAVLGERAPGTPGPSGRAVLDDPHQQPGPGRAGVGEVPQRRGEVPAELQAPHGDDDVEPAPALRQRVVEVVHLVATPGPLTARDRDHPR